MVDFRQHEELVNNLESALDFSRVVSVFNTLLGILKDQQAKIEDSEEKIAELTALVDKNHRLMKAASDNRPADDVSDRIRSIEEKLEEIMQHVNGTNDADNSILHDTEVSPFMMFHNAGALFSKPEPIPLPTETNSKDTPAIVSSRVSARGDKPFPIQEENSYNGTDDASLEDTSAQYQEDIATETPSLEVENEEIQTETEAEPLPITEAAAVVEEEKEAPVTEEETQTESEPEPAAPPAPVEEEQQTEDEPVPEMAKDPSRPMTPANQVPEVLSLEQPEESSSPANKAPTPKASRPPSALKPPSTDAATNDSKPNEKSLNLSSVPKTRVSFDASSSARVRDPSPQPSARPPSALRPKTPVVEDSGPRFNVGKYAGERLANTGGVTRSRAEAAGFRRKMSLSNLPFLTTPRLKKIVKEIKTRGRFIIISKNILENAKKKYAGESLKQRIDYLEADLMKLNNKYMKLQDTVKKNNMVIKEMFPRNFQELWEKLDVFFGYLEKFGGIAKVTDRLELLMKADESVFSPTFLDTITTHLKKTALQEQGDKLEGEMMKYRNKMIEISGEMVTKHDISNMLKPSPASGSAGGGSAVDSNTDGNHSKLMNLIHKALEGHVERMELMQDEKRKKLTREVTIGALGGPSSQDLERMEFGLQKYTDEKLQELNDEMDKMQRQNALKGSHMEEDILFMKEKIHGLELVRDINTMEHEKMEQARKEEMEALMVLQKRISNLSVDRVMDDLKALQKDVQERPSAQQVNEMIESIESTFKGHLGENVTGLKTLVHQVYRHIQHKVDRDDIKRLITAKLTQMEKEIVNKEEEMMRLASSTRCMSCGQVPRPSSTKGGKRAKSAGQQRIGSPPPVGGQVITNSHSPTTTTQLMLDDELSLPDTNHAPNASIIYENSADAATTNSPYSSSHTEQVYALLTGQVGLRPIQLRHQPINPVSHPSVIKGTNKSLPTEKIPEPLYRKARMSAQIKEMVKVQSPALDSYGYHAANPLYVYDGYAAEEAPSSYVPASRSGMRSRSGPRGPGVSNSGSLEYSNSLTSVGINHKAGNGGGGSAMFSQSEPRREGKDGFVLPEIHHKQNLTIGYHSDDNDSQHTHF